MDKELRGYVIELITMIIILIFIVPICANASNKYSTKQEILLNGLNTTIDITNKEGNLKQLNLYSNVNKPIKVKLGLKITKFYDEYTVTIDDQVYNLNDLEYLEDENNRYYILGTYEIKEIKNIDFELKVKERNYYDEFLTYSFYTEGTI